MKKLLTALLISATMINTNAQIGLGITTPHPNAYFQVNSITKGVLLPRMTALQRIAIAPSATANGLLLYDTDSTAYMYWNGAAWQKINAGNPTELWQQNGNDLYNTNTGNVGIGVNTPVAPLSFASTAGDKIALWGNDPDNHYGIGIQGGLLQVHTAFAVDNIAFGFGSSNSFTETMRIQGDGNVGIGTNMPAEKLEVAGKIRMVDGTQEAGRILSCDANGTASWVKSSAVVSAVYGFFSGPGANITSASPAAYIEAYIDLPPGKWIVFGNFLLSQGGSGGFLQPGQSMWVRTGFSNSSISNIPSGDVIGSGLMSGSLVSPSQFGLVTGQTIINNTSGATRRYYVWASMENFGGEPVGFTLDGMGSNFWGENQLTAIPMN